MDVLLKMQKLADIHHQSRKRNPPIKRGQKRLAQRLEQGQTVHNGDRPCSRAVQKLANRYSVIKIREIG